MVVDVRAIGRRDGDLNTRDAAQGLGHVLRVGLRLRRPLVEVLQRFEADDGLRVRKALGVLIGKRMQRPDLLPQKHVGVRVDQRRDPQDGEERNREHPRLDENALQPSRPQAIGDALLAGPRQRLDQPPHLRCQRAIRDEREPAAVAVERLQRLEAEERARAERADGLALVERAQRVRAVLEDDQVVPRRDREQPVHVARQPVQVRGDDRARLVGDEPLDRIRIDRERLRIDIGEDDREPGDARQLGHDPERQRRKDDLGPRRQVERLQDVVERHAAVGRRDGARRVEAVARGERRFELRNLGTLDELAAGLASRDELFGVGKDSRSVARDGSQQPSWPS